MCAPIIVKGSVCSVCVILPFAGPLFPGYAPGYFICSGCISLSRVFTVDLVTEYRVTLTEEDQVDTPPPCIMCLIFIMWFSKVL
jgi:hypothetical protein